MSRSRFRRSTSRPGVYALDAAVHARDGAPYDYWRDVLRFEVTAERPRRGRLEPAAALERLGRRALEG